jgi:hypothetical protein
MRSQAARRTGVLGGILWRSGGSGASIGSCSTAPSCSPGIIWLSSPRRACKTRRTGDPRQRGCHLKRRRWGCYVSAGCITATCGARLEALMRHRANRWMGRSSHGGLASAHQARGGLPCFFLHRRQIHRERPVEQVCPLAEGNLHDEHGHSHRKVDHIRVVGQ